MDFERLKKIVIEQLGIDEDLVKPDTALSDLGVDSLDLAELVMTLEDEYDIHIEDEDMEKISTIEDVLNYIND